LPNMARPLSLPVEALGITHVQRFEGLLQPIVSGGDGDQMDVVRHQAIGQHFNLVLVGVFFEPSQVNPSIIIVKKHRFTPIAALGDVVRITGKNSSG